MKKSCKYCWALSAVLAIGIAAMAYMFIIRGNVTESSDGRTAILISAGERDFVLGEMRQFLESVQTITEALTENDMKTVAATATKVGSAAVGGVPLALMAKFPLEFKTLGLETHSAFDAVAKSTEGGGDMKSVLISLSKLMNNCTTCHAGYRLDVESAGK